MVDVFAGKPSYKENHCWEELFSSDVTSLGHVFLVSLGACRSEGYGIPLCQCVLLTVSSFPFRTRNCDLHLGIFWFSAFPGFCC